MVARGKWSYTRITKNEGGIAVDVTRRTFLGAVGTGTAAATVLQFPLVGNAGAAAQAGTVAKSANEPIRLGANENAYGPSSRVREAIGDAMAESNRYPDHARREFVKLVANKHRVSPEQVLTGCGSV